MHPCTPDGTRSDSENSVLRTCMSHFGGMQGGAIQDVSIRLAPDAFAGFGGGGGAGTSHVNVAVTGGVHGAWFLETEGAALLGAVKLTNQYVL